MGKYDYQQRRTRLLDIHLISGAATAFLAGLATSPHCVGMCGPIGCAVIPLGKGGANSVNLGLYHAARVLAYTFVGGVAGAVGSVAVDLLQSPPARVLPWVLVAVLVAVALRLDRLMPKPVAVSRYYGKLTARLRTLPGPVLGAGLGFLTPLLPCGPLYLIVVLCLFSGSVALGAELALGFALGTVPLLWLGQSGLFFLRGKLTAQWLRITQAVLGLGAAALISWRMIASGGNFGEWLCH